ncbi:hypothetical protein [Tanticharoenia sakaeratensis]|jgi:hypothetical protein|uniref:Uncharacterized protein n=1 Tax=Tanticharoenia sakaeratensis NBRC 103193 TaxID=1231623 RepID=A0A0D6MQ33_9PROT|nr:hypothetical protein [Tanticharoenia sakaeratensis]GAN55797.1 hypothetical protein Tasa_059_013 [Tanticharoenia sakaeratensis NBRC 103193]GBQ21610.1 hypothetical protein AA103193_1784 [Tanticharoenia sakaeratensis NBRC 103193]
MSSTNDPVVFDGEDNKHHAARLQAEAALRDPDPESREAALDAAMRTDPEAVADVLAEAGQRALPEDLEPQDDDEIAALSRTVQPHSDAPSRAGITEQGAAGGSGADDEQR